MMKSSINFSQKLRTSPQTLKHSTVCESSAASPKMPHPLLSSERAQKQMHLASVMFLHPHSQSGIGHRPQPAGSLGSCFSHPCSILFPAPSLLCLRDLWGSVLLVIGNCDSGSASQPVSMRFFTWNCAE